MSIEQEKLEELKSKHGDEVYVLDGELDVAFTKPSRGDYKRFIVDAGIPAKRADALETLARMVVVHPSKEDFLKLLDAYPGIGPKVANEAALLAASEAPVQAKKA